MPTVASPTDVSTRAIYSTVSPGMRNRLKQATAQAHRDLDARFAAFDLTSVSGYRRFLEASASALLPLEAALVEADVMRTFTDWDRRSRRRAMAADLARLGGVTRPQDQPGLNRNSMLGTMYVLEGSRLGARFLLRSIANATDAMIASATAYLGHGQGLHLWQGFLTTLENQPVTPADEAEAIDGARHAFAMFAQAAARA